MFLMQRFDQKVIVSLWIVSEWPVKIEQNADQLWRKSFTFFVSSFDRNGPWYLLLGFIALNKINKMSE